MGANYFGLYEGDVEILTSQQTKQKINDKKTTLLQFFIVELEWLAIIIQIAYIQRT